MPRLFLLFPALAVALVAVGCGGNNAPELGQVSGRVTLGGKALPQAKVIFTPEKGRASIGTTDGNGRYRLQYTLDASGAIPGKHKVSITTGGFNSDGGLIKEQVPIQYNYDTELTAEVNADDNEINFALETRGPIVQPTVDVDR